MVSRNGVSFEEGGIEVEVGVGVEEGTAEGGGGGSKNWTSLRKTQDKVEFVS